MIKEIFFIMISAISTILMYNRFFRSPYAYWFGILNVILIMIIDKIFHMNVEIDIENFNDDDFDDF